MSSVMVALQQRKIGCHFCHQFILREVGSLALASSTRDLESRFTYEIDANDYFIAAVITSYLTTTLHAFRNNKRKVARLKRKISQVKQQWSRKRDLRRLDESYLGLQPFPYELRRCCEEFYKQLKKVWGFAPEKLFLTK